MKLKSLIKRYLKNVAKVLLSETLHQESEDILRGIARLQTIASLHQKTFSGYKDKYKGKDIVLIGGGPTVNQFKPIENCIYVGLNRACLLENVKFDYLFTIDRVGVDKIYPAFGQYDCVKFVGDQNLGPSFQIPESKISEMKNVYRYKTDAGLFSKSHFALDIATEPLGNFNTAALQAMQFILFTNPRRVYLVGMDCSTAGHFNSLQGEKEEHYGRMKNRGEDINVMVKDYVKFWYQLKDFADQYYPNTEIISVNPVGLRGLFTDLDQ